MDNDFYQDKTTDGEEINFEELMPQKNNRRVWSVAALIISIASVLCCCIPGLGIALGVFAVIFALISRINLGYFDKISIGALIMGAFGIAFGISSIIALQNPELNRMIQEMLKNSEQ